MIDNRDRGIVGPIKGARVTSPLPELREDWLPQPATIKPQKAGKSGAQRLLLAGALIFGMLAGSAGTGTAMLLATQSQPQPAVATAPAPVVGDSAQPVAQIEANTIRNIYARVSPSVVRVNSVAAGPGGFGGGGSGTGTGIVLDKEGYILTNNHVVAQANSVSIELSDGSEYQAAVVGTAPQDDLAILKADAPASVLVPAQLGDSGTVQTGDAVIAVGYPFGLDQSVTSGIVSGINRDWSSAGTRTMRGMIQTDAAINPGNSGGPLLNDRGEVIGINTLIESPVGAFTGIGFAIPINRAKDLRPQLQQGGELQRPWIGISGAEITAAMQAEFELPVGKGILVSQVIEGGPAAEAGLRGLVVEGTQRITKESIRDIIVSIDGREVASVAELTGYLDGKQPGDKVSLGIIREGQNTEVELTLKPWPKNINE